MLEKECEWAGGPLKVPHLRGLSLDSTLDGMDEVSRGLYTIEEESEDESSSGDSSLVASV